MIFSRGLNETVRASELWFNINEYIIYSIIPINNILNYTYLFK